MTTIKLAMNHILSLISSGSKKEEKQTKSSEVTTKGR